MDLLPLQGRQVACEPGELPISSKLREQVARKLVQVVCEQEQVAHAGCLQVNARYMLSRRTPKPFGLQEQAACKLVQVACEREQAACEPVQDACKLGELPVPFEVQGQTSRRGHMFWQAAVHAHAHIHKYAQNAPGELPESTGSTLSRLSGPTSCSATALGR
eukprot:1159197-Pelagomonas_calceolata.AAC.6